MKTFKLSDYLKPDDCSVRLYFPHDYSLNESYKILIYRDFDLKTNPYSCNLECWYNGDYHRFDQAAEGMDEAGVEKFVNECFEYVRSNYVKYLVGDKLFNGRAMAERYANGGEIVEVRGPYDDEKLYEFYEGDGEFED